MEECEGVGYGERIIGQVAPIVRRWASARHVKR